MFIFTDRRTPPKSPASSHSPRIALRVELKLLLYESLALQVTGAGGKPLTWFPPGGLVEHTRTNEKSKSALSCQIFEFERVMPASRYYSSSRRPKALLCESLLFE